MLDSLLNFCIEILASKLLVQEDGAFGKELDHEDGALIHGASILIGGDPLKLPSPFFCVMLQ